MLTPKQTHIIERAKDIFGDDKVTQFNDAIIRKLGVTFEIELMDLFTDEQVQELLNDVIYNTADNNLNLKYIVPPFSVLDTKTGVWLNRRRLLDEYLGSSLVGRDGGLAYGNLKVRDNDNGTSQFDSMLCEVLLKWFGLPGGWVFDPFAGGHVRGTMASLIGYHYLGIDLNAEQIAANIKRGQELNLQNVSWVNDDSQNLEKYLTQPYDLFFTCPPYGDLEQYTTDPRDLSVMDYGNFIGVYADIISKAIKLLKPNRFAVIVVADFRDSQGFYRGFVKDTIIAFEQAGMQLYNELILLNAIGTASMRASNTFSTRKVVKVHQNVLVFYKGDPKQIKNLYNLVDSRLPLPKKPKTNDQLF